MERRKIREGGSLLSRGGDPRTWKRCCTQAKGTRARVADLGHIAMKNMVLEGRREDGVVGATKVGAEVAWWRDDLNGGHA
jgi:hypothetical protein